MPQPLALGLHVTLVVGIRRHLDRHPLDNLQAIPFQSYHLRGIVRQQANLTHAEVEEDLSAKAIMSQFSHIAPTEVDLNDIQPLVLWTYPPKPRPTNCRC